jgi:hypothetical protein
MTGDEARQLRTFLTNLIAEEQQAHNEQLISREYKRAGIEPPATTGLSLVSPSLVQSVRSHGERGEPPKRSAPKPQELEFKKPCTALEAAIAKLQAAKALR